VGFPCPRTYLPESEDDLRRIAEELGFPLVVKPRFTAGSRGTEMVKDLPDLLEKTRRVAERHGMPIIQEYIPGKRKQNFHLMLDKKGALKIAFCPNTLRNFFRIKQDFPTARESGIPHPHTAHAARLAQRLGCWGGTAVETKIDARDGIPKLMEINPRLGYLLWNRTELGINQPLMCLKVAKGEEVEAVNDYSAGTILLDPIEDLFGLAFCLLDKLVYKFRTEFLGRTPIDSSNPPMALKQIFHSYKRTHFNGHKKVFNPYFRYFLQDPLVSILWWLTCFATVLRAANQLGR
jgi:predicted ATP-grasp superfamily ATP-dependent carboligase